MQEWQCLKFMFQYSFNQMSGVFFFWAVKMFPHMINFTCHLSPVSLLQFRCGKWVVNRAQSIGPQSELRSGPPGQQPEARVFPLPLGLGFRPLAQDDVQKLLDAQRDVSFQQALKQNMS